MTEMFKGVTAIAFDLDGTLVDSVPDLTVACAESLQEQGLPRCSEASVRSWVGNGAEMLIRRALAWALDDQPNEMQVSEALSAFKRHYEANLTGNSRLYPGVSDTLTRLGERGYRLALITNKPYQFVPPLLESLGIDAHFEVVFGGDSLPEKKPSPLPLLHLCQQWQLPPQQLLMVGDSRNDVDAAHAAKAASVALTYGYNHGEPVEDSQPSLVLDNFETLLAYLPAKTEETIQND